MAGADIGLGDTVLYEGRGYVVRGFSRLSLSTKQYVQLQAEEGGERLYVLLEEVQPLDAPPDGPFWLRPA